MDAITIIIIVGLLGLVVYLFDRVTELNHEKDHAVEAINASLILEQHRSKGRLDEATKWKEKHRIEKQNHDVCKMVNRNNENAYKTVRQENWELLNEMSVLRKEKEDREQFVKSNYRVFGEPDAVFAFNFKVLRHDVYQPDEAIIRRARQQFADSLSCNLKFDVKESFGVDGREKNIYIRFILKQLDQL